MYYKKTGQFGKTLHKPYWLFVQLLTDWRVLNKKK